MKLDVQEPERTPRDDDMYDADASLVASLLFTFASRYMRDGVQTEGSVVAESDRQVSA